MSVWRIIRYGFLLWLVGLVLTLVEALLDWSPGLLNLISYFSIGVWALIFTWLFFIRLIGRGQWFDGLKVVAVWLVLGFILDSLVYVYFFMLPWPTLLGPARWLGAFETLLVGGLTAFLIGRRRPAGQPEGLAN